MACVRCTASTVPTAEYTVTKPSGEVQREFCVPCAEITAVTYPVKTTGRKPVAVEPKVVEPPAVPSSSSETTNEEE